jgi:hypothetical protein
MELGDVELLDAIYDLVAKLDDSPLFDDLNWYLSEAFERFAPAAELGSTRMRIGAPSDENYAAEFDALLNGFGRRHEARLRARAERQRHRDYGDA